MAEDIDPKPLQSDKEKEQRQNHLSWIKHAGETTDVLIKGLLSKKICFNFLCQNPPNPPPALAATNNLRTRRILQFLAILSAIQSNPTYIATRNRKVKPFSIGDRVRFNWVSSNTKDSRNFFEKIDQTQKSLPTKQPPPTTNLLLSGATVSVTLLLLLPNPNPTEPTAVGSDCLSVTLARAQSTQEEHNREDEENVPAADDEDTDAQVAQALSRPDSQSEILVGSDFRSLSTPSSLCSIDLCCIRNPNDSTLLATFKLSKIRPP
ncbi:hypothetical protein CCACVL1_06235 [Corchorus capsularis]|uniref:Uncharacterized protein n=1 Tax=Corchorus capsularis TaxID=210143 RepID=A0A1R3JGQ0_COCAP|nr:hypothetical protein CCACVL1_06235 [Corchorus capsularis]